jgi:uncharacterized protein (DUF1697 family)
MTPMKTYVALLRGINVGGKRRLPMAGLKTALESLGLENVVTYVQSGNVVFDAAGETASELASRIEKRIERDFDLDVTVVLRTPAELANVAAGNPFLKREAETTKLHVVFLDRKPAAKAVSQLDPDRSPPDELEVGGREIYLHLPGGSARTKLTIDYIEKRLGVRGTQRNWNTVTKLAELSKR